MGTACATGCLALFGVARAGAQPAETPELVGCERQVAVEWLDQETIPHEEVGEGQVVRDQGVGKEGVILYFDVLDGAADQTIESAPTILATQENRRAIAGAQAAQSCVIVAVPDVTGASLDVAEKWLAAVDLLPRVGDAVDGTVTSQDPEGGTFAVRRSEVALEVAGTGGGDDTVPGDRGQTPAPGDTDTGGGPVTPGSDSDDDAGTTGGQSSADGGGANPGGTQPPDDRATGPGTGGRADGAGTDDERPAGVEDPPRRPIVDRIGANRSLVAGVLMGIAVIGGLVWAGLSGARRGPRRHRSPKAPRSAPRIGIRAVPDRGAADVVAAHAGPLPSVTAGIDWSTGITITEQGDAP